MNNLLENLNPEQLKAVQHDAGPLLIVAGAGTGKTTVISQRIAYLIEQGQAKPDEILALTFTEKAAGEMEERVDRLLPMGYVDLWISTFHSFGERIVSAHGLDIGLSLDARLMNEFEQWALIKKNLDEFDLDYYRPLGNPTKFIHALLKHFSRLKDEDISPAEYLEYAEELRENLDNMLGGSNKKSTKSQAPNPKQIQNSKFHPQGTSQIPNITNADGKVDKEIAEQEVGRINEVANAYHVYQQLLLDNNALDFGDLINYTLKLFRERPKILEQYRKQFKYILLDEFQDTNWSQYELIKLLAAPRNNLVVVGDDDQSIYKFRGASVSNILEFKKDHPQAREIILTKNYRNKQNILDLSYDFIQLNNPNRLEYQLNRGQKEALLSKKLKAQTKEKGIIEVIQGEDVHDEIRQVVEKIAEIKITDKQSNWSDFAVLTRSNEAAKGICATLEAAGLPYQFLASRGLYAKPLIMDIIAYLKLLDNYHESAALYRVLNLPVFDFSYSELVNFNYIARKKAWSLFTVLRDANSKLGQEAKKKIDQVLYLVDKHTALARHKPVLEVFMAFLNDSGYLKHISQLKEQESMEQIAYLNQFKRRIDKFMAGSDELGVKQFLNELNLEIEAGEEGTISPDLEIGPDTIKIMTVHGAKGLEFKYVFIAGLVDRRFPTIERKEAILIPDALVKETLPVGDIHLEEERRLFYVAMTRAKHGLFFSWAPDYGGARKKKPSRFLAECNLVDTGKTGKISKTDMVTKKIDVQQDTAPATYQPPTYFSYTQLAAFANCPYQYRFAHILKIPCLGKPQFSFGKTMHSTLQKLFELINEKQGLGQGDLFSAPVPASKSSKEGVVDISLDEVLALYEQCWIDDWYQSHNQKEEFKKKGKEIIKEFYAKHKDNWPLTQWLEKGFNLKIPMDNGLYTVRGVIDRVDRINGKVKIVDYKTGAPKEKLSFNDKEQLLIYQLAMRDIFKIDVESLAFYYLNNNSELEFLGSEEDLDKVQDKIKTTIQEIKQGKFLPKPGPLCKYCDFFEICEHRRS